ncbi:hypothetical protein [Mesonia sp.]|uniref:hypothetical protein n=1 Tax=Mesonia sp. TaxID=1960830 RepID=UPI003F996890
MKIINIKRGNEYVSNLNTIRVFINNEKYELDTNSSIQIKKNDPEISIYAKYLWIQSKKIILNPNQNIYDIKIRPLITNRILIFSVLIVLIFFIINLVIDTQLTSLLFKIIGISFLAFFIFIMTLGHRYYFKFEINKNLKNK